MLIFPEVKKQGFYASSYKSSLSNVIHHPQNAGELNQQVRFQTSLHQQDMILQNHMSR